MKIRLLAAVGVALLAAQANADAPSDQAKLNKHLQGQYAGQEVFNCLVSDAGFGPRPQLAALGPVHATAGSSTSITTYSGDGTVTVDGSGMELNSTATPPANSTVTYPVTTSNFSCQGTYQVNADDTFTQDVTCTGNTTAGVLPGLQFTLTGYHISGRILNKLNLSSQNDGGAIQTTTIYGVSTSMCSRTFLSKKIPAKN
jgi:hypothetical protein